MPRAATALAVALLAAATASAQPSNLSGARTTVQPAAADFSRQVRGLAPDPDARWIGWSAPAGDESHQICCWESGGWRDDSSNWCCGRCRLEKSGSSSGTTRDTDRGGGPARLEAPSEILLFARVEAGHIRKVRVFSADCAIDATGAAVVWITGVPPDSSVALLESLAASESEVASSAVGAIAHHAGPAADRALGRLVVAGQPRSVRKNAAFWLGNTRGRAGYEILRRVAPTDTDEDFRKHATFALSQSRDPEAVSTLFAMAKNDASPHVRGQALFWLAQKAGKKAAGAIEEAIRDDPDTEVKTKAVFALTQMPDNEGVPQLIHVARSNRNAEVRKKAMFWLGQSKDPRALAFFEEVLMK
jgi:hypothetical protein